jgi:hypothetical protein
MGDKSLLRLKVQDKWKLISLLGDSEISPLLFMISVTAHYYYYAGDSLRCAAEHIGPGGGGGPRELPGSQEQEGAGPPHEHRHGSSFSV